MFMGLMKEMDHVHISAFLFLSVPKVESLPPVLPHPSTLSLVRAGLLTVTVMALSDETKRTELSQTLKGKARLKEEVTHTCQTCAVLLRRS